MTYPVFSSTESKSANITRITRAIRALPGSFAHCSRRAILRIQVVQCGSISPLPKNRRFEQNLGLRKIENASEICFLLDKLTQLQRLVKKEIGQKGSGFLASRDSAKKEKRGKELLLALSFLCRFLWFWRCLGFCAQFCENL